MAVARGHAGTFVARAIRNAIRANRFARIIRNWNPYFYSASGRFARITRISDSRESPDSRESCESIRANHATRAGTKKGSNWGHVNNLKDTASPSFSTNADNVSSRLQSSGVPWMSPLLITPATLHQHRQGTLLAHTLLPSWKATKEYLNQRDTKIRVFRVCFRAPFLPPFFPHFSPLFPLQALCILAPLLPSSPPPSSHPFWLPEKSDLGTPLI